MHDDSWNGTRVLVTGAGGFIGSHLVEHLAAAGADIRAFVRYTSRPQAGWLDEIDPGVRAALEIVRGDIRDADAVRRAAAGAHTIFHLAALIGIPYSYLAPRETVETNVTGTLNVLEAAREAGVERVVHTSTSEVYGTARYAPIDEAHPLQGQSPYSASKIGADKIAESFVQSFGTPVVTVRPFNTYGPRQSARAVIPTIITQALAGTVVKLGNTGPRRDFTFVADTVTGFARAARAPAAVGATINLGSSADVSVAELVDRIGAVVGKTLTVEEDAERVRPTGSEVERLLADTTAARDLLGWEAATSFADGLEQTVAWIAANPGRFRTGEYER